MLAGSLTVGDGAGDVVFGGVNGVAERVAGGETGSDGGGVGAAGAVGGDAGNKGGAEEQFGGAVVKDVNGLAAGGSEMSAFDEGGATEGLVDVAGGAAEVLGLVKLLTGEDRGLVEVGGDERGEREELLEQNFFGGGFEETGAAGGDHDGIDDEGDLAVAAEEVDDGPDDGGGIEHAGLGGGRGEFGKDCVELLANKLRSGGVDGADAARVLGGEAGDGGGAVDTELAEDLKVGLKAGAAAAVRAGDGEGDRFGAV